MNTAQRVLLCRDILAEIFEQMSPDWLEIGLCDPDAARRQRKAWRRTLASCARVCHGFRDPALDVLWRVLDDVDVVFDLLPSLQRTGPLHRSIIVRAMLSLRP